MSAIINCRPLSHFNLSDSCIAPLSPNHLLTHKSRVVLSPPGDFVRQDLYLAKRWRRVQHLANLFWTRWRQEYLDSINKRSKWNQPQRNISVNDIVLIVDENAARNEWKLARVVEVMASNDGLVRSAKLQLATTQLDAKGKRLSDLSYFTRPIHKLILSLEA